MEWQYGNTLHIVTDCDILFFGDCCDCTHIVGVFSEIGL